MDNSVVCPRLSVSGDDRKSGRETKPRSFLAAPFLLLPTDREPEKTSVFLEDENACQGTSAVRIRKVTKSELQRRH